MLASFTATINSLMHEPYASLLNGILFGVKSSLPVDLYQSLLNTGVVHIVALSGMNISILISLSNRLFLGFGKKISIFLSLILIILFIIMTGASPSIVRAGVMGGISLAAVLFGRQYYGLLSLVLTSILMLFYDISLIKNVSFQLSVLATFGIILANSKVECQTKNNLLGQFIFYVKENFRLTLYAQIFTLPLILWHFGRISLVAPFANLAIEWVIQPVMVFGFLTVFLGSIFLPLGIIPSYIVWMLLSYLIFIIRIFANLPFASISF
jgi:competence protein ComEC